MLPCSQRSAFVSLNITSIIMGMPLKKKNNPKIIILGAGPCGLGAAWRLTEIGYKNFLLFERHSYAGGLASSFKDGEGFTWDIGGHVQFSHYEYFDRLMDTLLKDDWLFHERSSFVWIKNRFVPYPFQQNIRYLPKEDLSQCLEGLLEIHKSSPQAPPMNFEEWIYATLGKGIAELFMIPYNKKVWAYHPQKLSYGWIGERVALTDIGRILKNIIFEKDDVSWGPNNKFRFPLRGGTGAIWQNLAKRIDAEKMHFNSELLAISPKEKILRFSNGRKESYDILISTIPLDILVKRSDIKAPGELLHSSVHIIGVGIKGNMPPHLREKCWMYFPEDSSPFYRVTVFSRYSPHNVPDGGKFWSLMAEVSQSPDKPVNAEHIKDDVLKGMRVTKLISPDDEIVSVWEHFEPYGYPTPSLKRDEALLALKVLEELGIYSRGRFGAWKYEVSNQDHTCMQGVEAVNAILLGEPEVTLWQPHLVNYGAKR